MKFDTEDEGLHTLFAPARHHWASHRDLRYGGEHSYIKLLSATGTAVVIEKECNDEPSN